MVPLTFMAVHTYTYIYIYTHIIYTIPGTKIIPEHDKDIYITISLSWWVPNVCVFFVVLHIMSSSQHPLFCWKLDVNVGCWTSEGVHSVAPTQLQLLRCRAGPCAVKVPCAMRWKIFWRTKTCRVDAEVGRLTWIPGNYQHLKELPFARYCFVSMLIFQDVQYTVSIICLAKR